MAKDKVIRPNVNLEVWPQRLFFPKDKEHEYGEYAIFSGIASEPDRVVDLEYDCSSYTISFKGPAPRIILKTKYLINADEAVDAVGNHVFLINNMRLATDWNNPEETKRALKYILTPSMLAKLYSMFENPAKLLEDGDEKSLTKVPGIGQSTAHKIIELYNSSKDNSRAYSGLADLNLTKNFIDKLVMRYKSPDTAIEKVRNNPYCLIQEVRGVGWNIADSIAQKLGLPADSDVRIKAWFYHYFSMGLGASGATFCPISTLFTVLSTTLGPIPLDKMKRCAREEVQAGVLHYDPILQRIGLESAYQLELNIAKEINRIAHATCKPVNNIEETIAKCEADVGYEYTDEQKESVRIILTSGSTLLTANAGSGKSATMYPVAQAMLNNGYRVEQCCLSGRAALNLTEATHIQGKTIHRLLGWFDEESTTSDKNIVPINADMVILDEVSMVGGEIFLRLLRSIPSGCRFVMVGDFGQLEPIGLGNVGNDIAKAGIIPHCHLTKIFRQAAKSGIVTESLKVYTGRHIIGEHDYGRFIKGELNDLCIVGCTNIDKCQEAALAEFKKLIDKGLSMEDCIMCVAKRSTGDLSARVLNEKIQAMINLGSDPASVNVKYTDNEVEYEQKIRVGDRVSVIENNYTTKNIEGQKCPIFNGNVGTVITIGENSMIVKFFHDTVMIPKNVWSILRLGYVITTHRAQGIGVPYVVAVADPSAYTLLSKELLYTQLTRAKRHCTLIGTPHAIRFATETTSVQTKNTWLKELLRLENEKFSEKS